jgi:hypothetical protein
LLYTGDGQSYDLVVKTSSSLIAALFAFATPLAVLAQPVDKAPETGGALGIVFALVLLGGVLFASLKSSKRGHQD